MKFSITMDGVTREYESSRELVTIEGKMPFKDFVLNAISSLPKKGDSKGIHSVFSQFNSAFAKYYGETANPVVVANALAAEGVITIQPRRGGVMLYKSGDAPIHERIDPEAVLAQILSGKPVAQATTATAKDKKGGDKKQSKKGLPEPK